MENERPSIPQPPLQAATAVSNLGPALPTRHFWWLLTAQNTACDLLYGYASFQWPKETPGFGVQPSGSRVHPRPTALAPVPLKYRVLRKRYMAEVFRIHQDVQLSTSYVLASVCVA